MRGNIFVTVSAVEEEAIWPYKSIYHQEQARVGSLADAVAVGRLVRRSKQPICMPSSHAWEPSLEIIGITTIDLTQSSLLFLRNS
jgi:hypothetical protein